MKKPYAFKTPEERAAIKLRRKAERAVRVDEANARKTAIDAKVAEMSAPPAE